MLPSRVSCCRRSPGSACGSQATGGRRKQRGSGRDVAAPSGRWLARSKIGSAEHNRSTLKETRTAALDRSLARSQVPARLAPRALASTRRTHLAAERLEHVHVQDALWARSVPPAPAAHRVRAITASRREWRLRAGTAVVPGTLSVAITAAHSAGRRRPRRHYGPRASSNPPLPPAPAHTRRRQRPRPALLVAAPGRFSRPCSTLGDSRLRGMGPRSGRRRDPSPRSLACSLACGRGGVCRLRSAPFPSPSPPLPPPSPRAQRPAALRSRPAFLGVVRLSQTL